MFRRPPTVIRPLRALRDPLPDRRDFGGRERFALGRHALLGIAFHHDVEEDGLIRLPRHQERRPRVGGEMGVVVGLEPDPALQRARIVTVETAGFEDRSDLFGKVHGMHSRPGQDEDRKEDGTAEPG